MNKKMILFLVIAGLISFSCADDNRKQRPIPKIEVFNIIEQEVPIIGEFVGNIHGQKDIAIRARAIGILEGIYFDEGSMIQQGKLLYSIESQQYESESAAKQSKLAEAKTNLAYTVSDLNRIRPLAENNAVSQSDLDAAIAKNEAAKANVEAAKAILRVSNIALSYTNVKAPITGIIGKTKAKVGDFVGQSPNPVILNVISMIDTILVDFYITESFYIKIFRRSRKSSDEERNINRERNNLELVLVDGSIFDYKGSIKFIDREVDPTTGAILVQAAFPNPDIFLRPGQFSKVRVEIDVIQDGILVPQRCVMELQGKYSVFIVTADNIIESRDVIVGPTVKNSWLITEGLESGDKIVYEGLQKVKSGMTVEPI